MQNTSVIGLAVIRYWYESKEKSIIYCEDAIIYSGKIYDNKADLWEDIKTTISIINPAENNNNLTKSIYNDLLIAIGKKCYSINKRML